MSIRQTSETTWERTFLAGDDNDYHNINITAEGIEIDYDMLPWAEIDKARALILGGE